MMKFTKISIVLVTMFIASMTNCHAQVSAKVEQTVKEIVKKYDGTKGISCMSVAKGSGLELVKLMFNNEFGKSFMKGVTSITVIDYSDASEMTCKTLHEDLDVFLSLLEEFDISKEEQFAGKIRM